jgi:hypothetical protein
MSARVFRKRLRCADDTTHVRTSIDDPEDMTPERLVIHSQARARSSAG